MSFPSGWGGGASSSNSQLGFGYGQSWVSLTASRALGTTYYNTTSRPILVMFSNISATPGVPVVNGVTLPSCGASGAAYELNTFVVPVGASYSVTGGTLQLWAELR